MEKVTIVKPSALFLMLRLLTTLFILETMYGLCFIAYLFAQSVYDIDRQFIYTLWVLQIVKFLAMLFILSDIGTRYLNSRYYIADHHMLSEKGMMNNEEKIYELNSLRKVVMQQDWLGKRLGYGTLRLLLGARGYTEEIKLHSIAAPHHIKEVLDAQLGAYY